MTQIDHCVSKQLPLSVYISLTLQSISVEIFSMTLCQSFSWPLILLSTSCSMLFSCSVMLSNCMRLTLLSRARLSAFWESEEKRPLMRLRQNRTTELKRNDLQFRSPSPPAPCQLSFHPAPLESCRDAVEARDSLMRYKHWMHCKLDSCWTAKCINVIKK